METLTYPIKTERLLLRPMQLSDLDDLFSMLSQKEVVKFLYCKPKNMEEALEDLQQKMKHTDLKYKGDTLTLAVILQQENKMIGEVHLFLKKPEHNTAEIGYVFNMNYFGHGYGSESVSTIMKIGFEHYKFHRIFAHCDARNIASYKLMEHLGMRREGHFIKNEFVKGEWTDELEYAILREEWQKI